MNLLTPERIRSAAGMIREGRKIEMGHVLAQKAQEPGVVMAELDFVAMQHWRSQLPSLQHRVL